MVLTQLSQVKIHMFRTFVPTFFTAATPCACQRGLRGMLNEVRQRRAEGLQHGGHDVGQAHHPGWWKSHHDFFQDFTIDFEWDFMGTCFFYCEHDVKWWFNRGLMGFNHRISWKNMLLEQKFPNPYGILCWDNYVEASYFEIHPGCSWEHVVLFRGVLVWFNFDFTGVSWDMMIWWE